MKFFRNFIIIFRKIEIMDYKIFSILFLILTLYSTLNLSCQMKGSENSNFNTRRRPMRLPSRLGKRENFFFLITRLFDQNSEAKLTQNHWNEKKRYTTDFSSYIILPMFKKLWFHSGPQDPGTLGMKNFPGQTAGSRDKNFQ